MFRDRTEAGQKLAQKLESYQGREAIVLALPRGGVVLGYEIARALSLPLDIFATRKIGHPSNPEYAIGAVDENGMTVLNEMEVALVNKQWLREEILRQKKEAMRRSVLYRKMKKHSAIKGKIAIIVDDGIATGFTMRLAVRAIKAQKPKEVMVAVPVASAPAMRALKNEGADEIIVLEPPEEFMGAVGAHYEDFPQVEDEEVVSLLKKHEKEHAGKTYRRHRA